MEPIVSICMITYNHGKFLKDAIEGVIMQKTNFPFELIIGDDCSKDNTREICIEYRNKYPDIIKLRLPEKNLGALPNFCENLLACNGQYIAMCEGDDYWTDPNKLQMQFDYLESHTDQILCSHLVDQMIVDGINEIKPLEDKGNRYLYFKDFASNGCSGVFTCSMMFRNTVNITKYFKQDWVSELDAEDHLILLLSTINDEPVYIIPHRMGVYRKHAGGVWTSRNILNSAITVYKKTKIYKIMLPLSEEQKYWVDWLNRNNFTTIIYNQKRLLPAFINKILNKILSNIPLLFGPKLYSKFIMKVYENIYIKD